MRKRPASIAGLVSDLRKMVFTAAKDWHRSVRINRNERDYIVVALDAHDDLLASLKMARDCIAYCRRAHKDVQSGTGFPVEVFLDAAIAKAEGRS